MAFNKYDSLRSLNDSTEDWNIRVRAQSIWKGITRQNGEFRGYNIIFFDDSSERIHALISSQFAADLDKKLIEGQIYTIRTFKVKYYNGDETNRAIRNNKHIFFTNETKIEKDVIAGLAIPSYSFDFFNLGDLEGMMKDNRYLIDVVAVVHDVQPKAQYTKETIEKSHVAFTITDGKKVINVTFFNEFGDSFLKAKEKVVGDPLIIIISAIKVSDWKGALNLTNFPATRFYLNVPHYSVLMLQKRLRDPNFYVMDIDDEEDSQLSISIMKVSELRQLKENYIEKKVVCQLRVKKVNERMNWYIPICTKCDIELAFISKKYTCPEPKCGRTYPYPDRRFQLYTLCADDTGTIPIIWPDDEICRITGKTVYDVEVDDIDSGRDPVIPDLLKFCVNKIYNFSIILTKENVIEGSKVYKASQISEHVEMSGTNSPNVGKQTANLGTSQLRAETELTDTIMKDNSPPSAKSSNKIRPRINVDVEKDTAARSKIPKFVNVKVEKM
ncbi:hypothetical protein POM88_008447 [Heracleum sosnowskyi]|uniref:Replication protein A 70 kDa DNA-binding subunit B/D first OB fold domain-containing protein n=1 Tax=Heracleum sosnowskyi TaxID=360622 RepID=A0AAD8N6I7_9APIA|nr:hypothetical protein POM88_008447 [Heracleum sosnowskyi]